MATIELRVQASDDGPPMRRVMMVERVPVAGDYIGLNPKRLIRVEAVVFMPLGVHDRDDEVDGWN